VASRSILASNKDSPDGTTVMVTGLLRLGEGLRSFLTLKAGRSHPDTLMPRTWKCTSVPATGRSASKVPIPPIFLP
jgi:hypothetical protein